MQTLMNTFIHENGEKTGRGNIYNRQQKQKKLAKNDALMQHNTMCLVIWFHVHDFCYPLRIQCLHFWLGVIHHM